MTLWTTTILRVFLPLALLVALAETICAQPADARAARFNELAAAARAAARSPRSLPFVLEMKALRPYVDGERYAAAFETLARVRGRDPGVAAHVDHERAMLAWSRRDDSRAREIQDELGLVAGWWILGPIAPSDEPAMAADAPPPSGLVPLYPEASADWELPTWVGAHRAWRRARVRADGILNLESQVGAVTGGVAYLRTYAYVPQRQAVALRYGAARGVRLWLNGRSIHRRNGFLEPVLDQAETGAELCTGWNEILVRVERDDRPWGLLLRVTDPAGRPIRNLRLAVDPDGDPGAGCPADRAPLPTVRPGSFSWWSQHADDRRSDTAGARFTASLGRVFREWRREVPVEHEPAALRAAVGEGAGVDELLVLAEIETRIDRRASALASLLHAHPDHVRTRLALVEAELDRQRYLRARELLDGLPATAREDPGAVLLEARMLAENQLYGDAWRRLDALQRSHPRVPAVLEAAARLAADLGRRKASRAAYEALAHWRGDGVTTLFWLYELARDQGELDVALTWLDRMETLRPDLSQPLLERARIAEYTGAPELATRALSQAVERFPWQPYVFEVAARYHRRRGHLGEAIRLLERALVIEPHNVDIRAYVHYLAPTGPSFEDPYRRAATDVAARFQRSSSADLEVLLDQQVVRVYTNGATVRYRAEVILVNRPPADEGGRTYRIPYDPLRQRVEIVDASVIQADGHRRELLKRREVQLLHDFALYYELQHMELPFDELSQGDVVSVAYRVVDLEPPDGGSVFGDLVFIQGVVPRHEVDYVVIAPAAMPLYHQLLSPSGSLRAVRSEVVDGGLRTVRYTVNSVPAAEVEPGSPGSAELGAYLHISTFSDFQAVGRFYADLLDEARRSSPAVRAVVAEATAGAVDVRERVRALHAAVVERTRYVGLELGIHGIQPYTADEVLRRGFGDCKDTSNLLVVMLREAGIDARLVLVRTRPQGRIASWPASLAAFDHAIVHVPELNLWIDPTVRDAPPGVLPPQDQGATALVITPGGGRLTEVPSALAVADDRDLRYDVELRADGAAFLRAQEEWRGWRAAELRAALRTATSPALAIATRLASVSAGVRVDQVQLRGESVRSESLGLSYVAGLPGLAERDGAWLQLPVAALQLSLARRLGLDEAAGGAARRLPFVVPYRFQDRVRFRVTMPPDTTPLRVPEDTTIDTPFGSLSRRIRTIGKTVEVNVRLQLDALRVAPEQMDSFLDFVHRVDEALAEPLRATVATAGTEVQP